MCGNRSRTRPRLKAGILSPAHILSLVLAGLMIAAPAGALERVAGESVDAVGEKSELSFFAGVNVRISATATDDLYAAGAEILVEGARLADLIAAGGFVEFRGESVDDLTVAGGNIEIAGEIADDLVAVGGRLDLERAARIGGDAVLAGGDVRVDAPIGGALTVTAGRVTLASRIGGDAEIRAGRIALAPGARIAGDLVYRSGEAPEIAEGAVVEGEIRRMAVIEHERGFWAIVGAILLGILFWFGAVISLIVLAGVLQAAVPALLRDAEKTLDRRPWASLGLGFAVLVATPVAMGLLFSTGVGVPVALLVLALYAIIIALGIATAGNAIGTRIARALGRLSEAERFWPRLGRTALGLFALAVVVMVPFIGLLAALIALLLGIGAALFGAWHKLRGPLVA